MAAMVGVALAQSPHLPWPRPHGLVKMPCRPPPLSPPRAPLINGALGGEKELSEASTRAACMEGESHE